MRKLTREEKYQRVEKIVSDKKGTILDSKYSETNSEFIFIIECKRKHIKTTNYRNLYQKETWCNNCAAQDSSTLGKDLVFIRTLDAILFAYLRDGECLGEYINSGVPIKFRCKYNHEWETKIKSIKRGSWCPNCKPQISEEICRIYFETIFNKKFPKYRGDWLRNRHGKKLELDGLLEGFNNNSNNNFFGFEHQGIQHFEYGNIFARTEKDLIKIQENDYDKYELCKSKGIKLIIIPALFCKLEVKDLKEFIKNECIKLNIKLPNNFEDITININEIYTRDTRNTVHTIEEMKEIAKSRNGECLSSIYIDTGEKLTWKCNKHNHIWEAKVGHILDGTWCEKCQREKRALGIEAMHILAKEKGGKCLSDKYVDIYTELYWECSENHKFLLQPISVKHENAWCKVCLKNNRKPYKYSLEKMQQIANKYGGKCLSNKYISFKEKLEWECKRKHKWILSADVMLEKDKTNKFCKECYEEKRKLKCQNKINPNENVESNP